MHGVVTKDKGDIGSHRQLYGYVNGQIGAYSSFLSQSDCKSLSFASSIACNILSRFCVIVASITGSSQLLPLLSNSHWTITIGANMKVGHLP